MSYNKKSTPIQLQSLDALFGDIDTEQTGVQEISLDNLHPFPGHPFKVEESKHIKDLCESVKTYGVLSPGIVRAREAGGYEIISGHCRKYASEQAGLKTMPVIIKELTDDEATVIMVDANIQREDLLISEKAFAYKMKYDALKRQGTRSDLTSCQLGKRLAARELSNNSEDSERQILRYIHLTLLIPELMDQTDKKQLPFNTAVEISYLKEEEQKLLLTYTSTHNITVSMKQAQEIKAVSKERGLEYSDIDQICCNKPKSTWKVQLSEKKFKQFFSEEYTSQQIEDIIFELLQKWSGHQEEHDGGKTIN